MKAHIKSAVVSVLTLQARAVLSKHHPKVIAVTGSVGKTSTKDAIFTVVSSAYRTRKSDKSFNSELGVPLTVLGLRNAWRNPLGWVLNAVRGFLPLLPKTTYPAWLVLEVGADRPGDIRNMAKWITPDIAVLTLLPAVPVHIEYFKNPEEVCHEKLSLAEAVKEGGVIIGNADDAAIADAFKKYLTRKVTYGFKDGADIHASNYSVSYEGEGKDRRPLGIQFSVRSGGQERHVRIVGVVGRQHAYPALAALAVASATGIEFFDAVNALEAHAPPPGRMRIHPGIQGSTLIDDSYNSSPVALAEALVALKDITTEGRRIAVLGDMLELGKYSVAEHEAAGREAAGAVSVLVTVGPRSRDLALAAIAAGMDERQVFEFADSGKAALYLEHIVSNGDVVLVKGSQGTRMERVSKVLLADQAAAKVLLVRQEKEWGRR